MNPVQARRTVTCLFFGGIATLFFSPAIAAVTAPQYEIETDRTLDSLRIRACFPGPVPRRLVALHPRANRYMTLSSDTGAGHVRQSGNELRLSGLEPGECIRYTVHLDRLPNRWQRGAGGFRVGGSVLLSPHLLLWLPDQAGVDEATTIRFSLPDGISVSAPWKAGNRSDHSVDFVLGPRPVDLDARLALGRFDVTGVDLPGARLRLAILPARSGSDVTGLYQWIENGARALTTVYGRFPVRDAQILVVPIGRSREPVPWAQVMRGGGDAVHLYVDETRSLNSFLDDWTLYHELSHLLHPLLDGDDTWLSEGLASYYQNVIQARQGRIDEARAWSNLDAGFLRGERGTPRDMSLAEATENMMRDRLFMRVYWSGAAVALMADAELRRRSGGYQSLDTAFQGLRECCLPFKETWSGTQLVEQLDVITDTDVFRSLYQAHRDSPDFPDLSATYRRLGLTRHADGEVSLADNAGESSSRRAIMTSPD
ncbi:MAG: hypothetical protein U9R74_19690 [Pseudomonadota bacterium]|nr:hypothetical protein [Pseudomonadota bacterium]